MEEKYEEYQGFDSLCIAEITEDSKENYSVGEVEVLAPAGEISKTTESDLATKYYDNQPYLNIASEGADEVTLTVPVLPLSKQAKITGKLIDEATGALLDDGDPHVKYFALLYRLKFTDGTYRYVVRHKGSFKMGDEAAKSQDSSTDSNNMTLTFTGIKTKHKFVKTNNGSKAIVADEREGKVDVSTWFEEVVTPDTIKAVEG